jgi:hypothetical protein
MSWCTTSFEVRCNDMICELDLLDCGAEMIDQLINRLLATMWQCGLLRDPWRHWEQIHVASVVLGLGVVLVCLTSSAFNSLSIRSCRLCASIRMPERPGYRLLIFYRVCASGSLADFPALCTTEWRPEQYT